MFLYFLSRRLKCLFSHKLGFIRGKKRTTNRMYMCTARFILRNLLIQLWRLKYFNICSQQGGDPGRLIMLALLQKQTNLIPKKSQGFSLHSKAGKKNLKAWLSQAQDVPSCGCPSADPRSLSQFRETNLLYLVYLFKCSSHQKHPHRHTVHPASS